MNLADKLPKEYNPIDEDYKKLLIQSIEKHGKELQIELIVEECAELIKAIQKMKRVPVDATRTAALYHYDVCDEIADVKIMIDQAMLMFDIEIINERINFKLNRLNNRLNSKEV